MTRILLAAGGTGGHVFPAVAVAEQLEARGLKAVFITDTRGKPMIANEFSANRILAASPYGKTKGERIKGLMKLAIGAVQTLAIMTFYRPKLVIGFGGYPAVAPVLVGKMLGRKTMLHEQNAFFGRANHFLARHVSKIALSWQNTNNISENMEQKAVVMGMPVRKAFREIGVSDYLPPKDNGDIHILIVGGSLGATIFGDTVPEALSRLPEGLRRRLKITHQVRENQIETAAAHYERAGITANIAPFIHDMPQEMAKAQLVVCRSGASSVAELAASGRPSILVPFPDAMDDHQTANAKAMADIGGGWIIPEEEMSAGSLAGRISTLITSPEKLTAAAAAASKLHKGHAASQIADEICALIGISAKAANNHQIGQES